MTEGINIIINIGKEEKGVKQVSKILVSMPITSQIIHHPFAAEEVKPHHNYAHADSVQHFLGKKLIVILFMKIKVSITVMN